MRTFLFEYVTGGGAWSNDALGPPSGSLLSEGAAMIRALAADFGRIEDAEVAALCDTRVQNFHLPGCTLKEVAGADEFQRAFVESVAEADWTLLIAPEFDGILLELCRQVEALGGKLLSPDSRFVELAADKYRTACHLRSAGVSVPASVLVDRGQPLPEDFRYPAVLKPRFGAGSLGVRLVNDSAVDVSAVDTAGGELCLERFCEGTAASVAALCGRNGFVLLQPCRQHLSDDGRFRYLGGSLLSDSSLADRAKRLAASAVRALPPTVGYVGVDIVLGGNPNGKHDVVIEINPRLTTSYVHLAPASRVNLAQALLETA